MSTTLNASALAFVQCGNAAHDHRTTIDRDGMPADPPIPMLCNDCGVPTHYDSTVEDYVHDDPSHGACFLAYAADEIDPAVSPCLPVKGV